MAHLASSRHGCRVEATRLEQVSARLARRAASVGCISLVTFFVQAKKVTRPYQSCFVRSRTVETGETMPPTLNGWWAISPVLTRMLHSKCAWRRASYFSCSCKQSNQKNTPQGVALRASRERSASGKAVPTQHPCCDRTKQAIHGLFTLPTALRSRRPQTGDEIQIHASHPWRFYPASIGQPTAASNGGEGESKAAHLAEPAKQTQILQTPC